MSALLEKVFDLIVTPFLAFPLDDLAEDWIFGKQADYFCPRWHLSHGAKEGFDHFRAAVALRPS